MTLIFIQLIFTLLVFPVFYFFGKNFQPEASFVYAFLFYWLLLTAGSLFFVIFQIDMQSKLKEYFLKIKRPYLSFINFIPVILVFFVAFFPLAGKLNVRLMALVLLIALFNGMLEEIFWRGLVLAHFSRINIPVIISTILFSVFHFAFLFLPLEYHGGALNLVGGAAFMGFIWLFITRYTGNIISAIAAHVLVNFFAFSGLFIENGLI